MIVHPKPADWACVRTGGVGGLGIRVGQWLNGGGFRDYEHVVQCVGPELKEGEGIPGTSDPNNPAYNRVVQPGEVWVQILEAMPGGAHIRYRKVEDTDLWSTGVMDQTDMQRKAAQKIAPSFAGILYSDLDYVALAAHRLHAPNLKVWPIPDSSGHLHLATLQTYVGWTGHLICSQLVDEFQLQLGNHLFDDGRWPGYVTPADEANLLVLISFKKTVI